MEPLIHFLIPVAFLMVLCPKLPRRQVLSLSFLAVFPDLDFYIGHAVFHNIFFVGMITYLIYVASKKNKQLTYISAYYLISHLILDLQYVALLYPLSDKIYSLSILWTTRPPQADGIAPTSHKIDLTSTPIIEAQKEAIAPILSSAGVFVVLVGVLAFVFKELLVGGEGKRLR